MFLRVGTREGESYPRRTCAHITRPCLYTISAIRTFEGFSFYSRRDFSSECGELNEIRRFFPTRRRRRETGRFHLDIVIPTPLSTSDKAFQCRKKRTRKFSLALKENRHGNWPCFAIIRNLSKVRCDTRNILKFANITWSSYCSFNATFSCIHIADVKFVRFASRLNNSQRLNATRVCDDGFPLPDSNGDWLSCWVSLNKLATCIFKIVRSHWMFSQKFSVSF